ncbi:MAG: HAMP domain-containing sensor histidine kinase [Pseudomonadota bacterium]
MVNPLTIAEGFALSSGLVQAFLALIVWSNRRMRPQWGLRWLSACFAMAALINVGAPALRSSGPLLSGLGTVLGVSCVAALVVGVRRYLGVSRFSDAVEFALVLPAFLLTAVLAKLAGAGVYSGHLAACLLYGYLLVMGCRHLQGVFGNAHKLLLATLALYPVLVISAMPLGLDGNALRYWASVPFTLVGLGITFASMGRLQQELRMELVRREEADAALRQLNETLERRIQERTDELQEMVSGLESFNAMVSHDLRGPLGGMQGLTQMATLALEQGDAPRAIRMVSSVGAEAQRLIGLVTDLLFLAKVSHLDVTLRRISLDEVLAEALKTLALSLGEDRVAVVQCDPLPQVSADAGLLCQVFVNLIGNALKFTQEGRAPEVRVCGQRTPEGIVVEVRDNGVGFVQDKSDRIFQPFMRLHGQTFAGSGIGLSIVKHIVERHGGRVWAQGRPGLGASFFVSLPS